jgi:hypothetical protein
MPPKTVLVGGDTPGNQVITIQRSSSLGFYTIIIGGVQHGGTYRPTGYIIVYGGTNDTIRLMGDSFGPVTIPAILFAGSGNGILDDSGCTANNILVGGAGNDTLTASGPGSSILIGGDGSDTPNAGTSTALVIGGRTAFDTNVVALLTLMSEWSSADTLAMKMSYLTGTLDEP